MDPFKASHIEIRWPILILVIHASWGRLFSKAQFYFTSPAFCFQYLRSDLNTRLYAFSAYRQCTDYKIWSSLSESLSTNALETTEGQHLLSKLLLPALRKKRGGSYFRLQYTSAYYLLTEKITQRHPRRLYKHSELNVSMHFTRNFAPPLYERCQTYTLLFSMKLLAKQNYM